MGKFRFGSKVRIAAPAVIVATTLGLAVPAQAQATRTSGHAAAADTCYYIADAGGAGNELYNNGAGNGLTVQFPSNACWTEINGQSWSDPVSGKTVQVYEFKTDGLCAKASPLFQYGYVSLGNCAAGSNDELFYVDNYKGLYDLIVNVAETKVCQSVKPAEGYGEMAAGVDVGGINPPLNWVTVGCDLLSGPLIEWGLNTKQIS